MPTYPMSFTASSTATSGIESSWNTTTADDRSLTCAIPKEFAGPNTGFSPEDLFLLALMNCYIATFKVIAANSKLAFKSLDATATLNLDHGDGGTAPCMKTAHLKFVASGAENAERLQRLMERVAKQCMIINSVKTAVTFEFAVQA